MAQGRAARSSTTGIMARIAHCSIVITVCVKENTPLKMGIYLHSIPYPPSFCKKKAEKMNKKLEVYKKFSVLSKGVYLSFYKYVIINISK
jgi:hypothetical protein